MSFTLRLRDRFRTKPETASLTYSESSEVTNQQDTVAAPNSSRTLTFDFDNELTRKRALQMSSRDEEGRLSARNLAPVLFSRRSRDSGVSIRSEGRDSSKRRSSRSRDVSPLSRPSLSGSRPVSARIPRLSLEADDGRRMSLGPAMEQWRREEEEEWQMVRQNGEQLPVLLTPALTSASTVPSAPGSPSWPSLDEDKGRCLSLANAIEQWRLEEDEDAKRTGYITPLLLTPNSVSVSAPTTPSWPTPANWPTLSSTGQDEDRKMSLGPAMEHWRLAEEEQEDDELAVTKKNNLVTPALLPAASPSLASKWPSHSPFTEDRNRRTGLMAAMEQWRVESEGDTQIPRQYSELPMPASRPQRSWPSLDPGVHAKKPVSLGPAMEQWRIEELDDSKKDGRFTAVPLPSNTAKSTASKPIYSGKTDRVMTLGQAMEAWRLEMC